MTNINLENTDNRELRSTTPPSGGRGAGDASDIIKASIRNIPDFPIPGIQFKDITTALKNPQVLQLMTDTLYDYYKNKGKITGTARAIFSWRGNFHSIDLQRYCLF